MTDHLDAQKLFVEYFKSLAETEDVVVVSPNVEGLNRADEFCDALSLYTDKPLPTAFIEEHRQAGVHSGAKLIGYVAGRTAIVFTDLISGGTGVARAARICCDLGACRVIVVATHGLFLADSERIFSHVGADCIVVTNTIPPSRMSADFIKTKLIVIDTAPLFGEAIRRIHSGGSIAELLNF